MMPRTLPALLAIAAVYACSILIASTAMAHHPIVAAGIAFDLTVTAAAVFWLLAIRPGHAKPRALLRVAVVGLAATRLLVGVRALGVAGGVLELALLALLAVRVRRIVRRARALLHAGHGLTAALDGAFRDAIPVPALASALAIEVSALTLAVIGWFRRPPDGFSMHRRSGYMLIVGVIAVLVVVEGVAMHLVIMQVSPVLATVLSAASLYGLVWLIGNAHATRLSPLRFTTDALVIERGVQARVWVPHTSIASATPITGEAEDAIDLSFLGANVLLTLRAPVAVHGLFGRARHTSKLALSIDDRERFIATLDRVCGCT